MADERAKDSFSSIDFADLKLRGGAWLQLRSFFDAAPDCEVEFVAALRNKSLFVSLPSRVAGDIQVGNRYLVRGFNGVCEFAFNSQVLHVEEKPFLHVHLTYPDSVDMRVVRHEQRLRVSIPVLVQPEGASEGVLGTIKDLSVHGAMIEAPLPPGEMDDRVTAVFTGEFEENSVELRVPAVVRHIHKQESEGNYRCGVEFGNIAQKEKLVLCYLLFTQSEAA